jgi:hypothetical protein
MLETAKVSVDTTIAPTPINSDKSTSLPATDTTESPMQPHTLPAPIPQHPPMTEIQVRRKMFSLTRSQLQSIILQLSQSTQPANTSVSKLVTEAFSTVKSIRTFHDAVVAVENHFEGFKTEMDLTGLIEYGKESTRIVENIVAAVIQEVERVLNKGVNGEQGGLQTWSNGLIALSKMGTVLATCTIKEVSPTVKRQMYDGIADGMLQLIPIVSSFQAGLAPGQIAATSKVRFRVVKLQEALEKDGNNQFRIVRGRMDEVFDLKEWTVMIPPIGPTELTAENLAKLSTDYKNRETESLTDYDYEYQYVPDQEPIPQESIAECSESEQGSSPYTKPEKEWDDFDEDDLTGTCGFRWPWQKKVYQYSDDGW